MKGKKYDLRIDSDNTIGTLFLYEGKSMVDRWIDEKQPLKNDLLLENISRLLTNNKVLMSDVGRIFLKKNYRSQTGYKVLISILKGISVIYGTEIIYED